MELGLKDRRALVMGSTRGIGFAIAGGLVAEGAAVAVCGRARTDAETAAATMNKSDDGSARGYVLDLGDDESVAALIAAVEGEFGGVDIVVCNGGGPPPGPIAEVAPDLWTEQFHKMFINQTRIATAFLPGMRQRGQGRVLVLASSGVVQPIESLGISNSLRGAQIGWAKTLSNEVAGDGVTVNTVVPGRIHTARVDQIDQAAADRRGTSVEDVVRASHAAIPMGRYGRVEECADVAVFLLGERASYVTGSVIRVDGGMIRSV